MTEFERVTSNIYHDYDKIDIIDAQEWQCVFGALSLKKALKIPFVYTVHSLEDHRSNNGKTILNASIKSIERTGVFEANQVIVRSQWMRNEVKQKYEVPLEKIAVIDQKSSDWVVDVLNVYERVVDVKQSLDSKIV